MKDRAKNNNQVVGNIGLFYVCYRLSLFGWNVMPTARNAKGIDILIYSQDAKTTHTVQVKALSKRDPVPLGGKLDNLFGDFFIICRNLALHAPECFVLNPEEVAKLAHKGDKNGKISYWLQPKQYEIPDFKERWDRIGEGSDFNQDSKVLEIAEKKSAAPVATVHRICNEHSHKSRKEIIGLCLAAGINKNTASTQYYQWRKKTASTML
jgi:hypothetical protein